MILSAAKSLYESASKQEQCSACKKAEYVAISNLSVCCLCQQKFCKSCIIKTDLPFPENLIQFKTEILVNEKESVCTYTCKEKCYAQAIKAWMDLLKEEMMVKFEGNLNSYLLSEQMQLFYEMPKKVEDSKKRQAMRAVIVVDALASLTGYSTAINAIKMLYAGNEIVNKVIAGDLLLGIMNPLMEALGVFDIKGPKGVLDLYYLSCKHVLDVKVNPQLAWQGHNDGDIGVISSSCPQSLVDYAGRYISIAQCLYACSLPAPHNKADWSSWYLTCLLRRQGWTVLTCQSDTTMLPDKTICPAFALLVRNKISEPIISSNGSDQTTAGFITTAYAKEAILIIRGTNNELDWSINFHEKPTPFNFYLSGPSSSSAPEDDTIPMVSGFVHSGMYAGAKSILDVYCMRKYISKLCEDGYEISVVGHSLGAGTTAVLAAELQNGFRLSSNVVLRNKKVRAIAFATPAVTCETLAQAFLDDGLVLNLVTRFDAVPRFSRRNLRTLAKEIKEFASVSQEWRKQDVDALQKYAMSCGKAGEMAVHMLEEEAEALDGNISTSNPGGLRPTDGSSGPATNSDVLDQQQQQPSKAPIVVLAATGAFRGAPVLTTAIGSYVPTFRGKVTTASSSAETGVIPTLVVSSSRPSSAMTAATVVVGTAVTAPLSSNNNSEEKEEANKVIIEPEKEELLLVIPGLIIHLFNKHNIQCGALINYKHPSLYSMTILGTATLDEHKMRSYSAALQSLSHQHHILHKSFPSKFLNPEPTLSLLTTPSSSLTLSNLSSQSSSQWNCCTVCGLDCNWAYILKSNGNRAQVSHTCGVCRKIVCTLCAPAGDSIPADGFNATVTLSDWRICVPSLAILQPTRVCAHCYFDSYNFQHGLLQT